MTAIRCIHKLQYRANSRHLAELAKLLVGPASTWGVASDHLLRVAFPISRSYTKDPQTKIFSYTQYASMAATELDPAAIAIAKGLEHTPWCDDYEKMISGVLSVPLAGACTRSEAN